MEERRLTTRIKLFFMRDMIEWYKRRTWNHTPQLSIKVQAYLPSLFLSNHARQGQPCFRPCMILKRGNTSCCLQFIFLPLPRNHISSREYPTSTFGLLLAPCCAFFIKLCQHKAHWVECLWNGLNFCSSFYLFARTAYSFVGSALLDSPARPAALISSLARSLTPELLGTRFFSMDWKAWKRRLHTVLTHCAKSSYPGNDDENLNQNFTLWA